MSSPSLDEIRAARARVSPHVHLTPLMASATLRDRCGAAILAQKCESLQKTGSFKVRGALNAVMQLDDAARARGVVTVSAGNHAQALAWAARAVQTQCTVVMPAAASATKAAASTGYGARVIRHGTGAEAFARAYSMADEYGYALVHPFDDMHVLAGAATVGTEILEDMPDVEVVIVPIGGGGLIAGIASAIKQMSPAVRVYGVEPEGAASMRLSLDAGKPMRLPAPPQTIADGLAAPYAGEMCFPIVQRFVDDVVLVSDAEIAAAMALILTRTKLLAEAAGAAAVAAALSGRLQVSGRRVVTVLSGGNIDTERLVAALGEPRE
jgi:threonine dehydratase